MYYYDIRTSIRSEDVLESHLLIIQHRQPMYPIPLGLWHQGLVMPICICIGLLTSLLSVLL